MSSHPMPASPLPWRVEHDGEESSSVLPWVADAEGMAVTDADNASHLNMDEIVHSVEDMEYIAWAANTAPALAAEVERLRAALEGFLNWCEHSPTATRQQDLLKVLLAARRALEAKS